MASDILFLYVKSDNLIKVEDLVKKSFDADEVIDDATITMSLFGGTKVLLSANNVNDGDAVLLAAGDAVNKGVGEVGIPVMGNTLAEDDKVVIAGTTNYNGTKTIKSVTPSTVVQEVQTLAPDAVATAGSFRLGYKGELTPAVNEKQTIAITGTPTGGTFTLTFGGQTTAAIAYNAAAAAVESALEALSTIGSGNVVCTGGALPGTAIVVEFISDLAGQPISAITADDSGLTGGTDPTVTITETVAGQGLPYNASTAVVQAALEALTTIGEGNIVVSGDRLDVGDMVFTFDAALLDVPLLTITSNLTGPTECPITQTVQGRPAGYTSEIVIDASYVAETFDGTETAQKITRGAVDRGSGKVGIPVLAHNIKVGEKVRIWGTRNYNGVKTITAITENEIQFAATYVAENFTGAEYLYASVLNANGLTFTAEGSGGDYSGVIPDTAEMVPDETYYLEIYITKGSSDLLIRYTCKAVFFPRKELY